MRNVYITSILFSAVIMISCNKDPKQEGCTDPTAINFDTSALKEDGSCQYNLSEQVIWREGMLGGWNGDQIQGAFLFNLCDGFSEVLSEEVDSVTTIETLYLGTGTSSEHKSIFTLLNQQDGRSFAEGSLRFDARIDSLEDRSPEFMRLFIDGKITEFGTCAPYKRSGFVDISTQSFNDSTFTPVNITLRDFDDITMSQIDLVCGFEFEGEPNTGIEIDNLRWVATFEE